MSDSPYYLPPAAAAPDLAPAPVAFVGGPPPVMARLPPAWVDLYCAAAVDCTRRGRLLTCGAAPGGDQLAAEVALEVGGVVQLYLPWADYEEAWVDRMLRQHGERVLLDVYSGYGMQDVWERTLEGLDPEHYTLPPAERQLRARTVGLLWDAEVLVALASRHYGEAEGVPRLAL